MSVWSSDGRTTHAELVARAIEGGLAAPAVGLFRQLVGPGALVQAGTVIGRLDVLGVLYDVRAPEGTVGVVAPEQGVHRGEAPVGYGDVLVRLAAAELGGAIAGASDSTTSSGAAGKLVFRSPLSGRFYERATPDRPPFVAVGNEITHGHTVALLEVMKTFNRIAYGGVGLPAHARVVAVLVKNEDDVDAGTPLFELEAM